MYEFLMNDVIGIYLVILLCTFLIISLLCALCSKINNLNHNLYFVFKANWMIWDVSEESILFTKLDNKKCWE